MRMIAMMCGKILPNQVLISVLREWKDVENIETHLRRHPLRWLEHFKRINVERLTRTVYKKKTWEQMVKEE